MEQMKKRNPLASTADLLRSVAAGWKKLGAEERRPYEKLVADDKASKPCVRSVLLCLLLCDPVFTLLGVYVLCVCVCVPQMGRTRY